MTHTPGPYTIQAVPHRNGHRQGFHYCIRDSRNINLAIVGEVDAATDGTEAEANAKLIAQAPAMLEALKRVVVVASCAPNDDPDLASQEFTRIMNIASQVIRDAS